MPRYRHIVEIMMENTAYGTIIGNPLAPNINALANRDGLVTNYFGVTHPSEPNYVANIGGSYCGIQDDMTWKGYFQNLPEPGGEQRSGCQQSLHVQVAEQHRCALRLQAQPVHQLHTYWREGNNAIVITWDEDDYSDQGQPGTGCCGSDPGGGQVVTIVIINHGAGHVVDNTPYNHYSPLRAIEAAFRLPCLAHACDSAVPTMAPLVANGRRGDEQRGPAARRAAHRPTGSAPLRQSAGGGAARGRLLTAPFARG